jgi:prepilin-type N-terminal cleavage/methylation domain-containing protein
VKRPISAFTLIELLIALALVGIVLSAVVYVYIGTTRSAASLQARNDLMPEMQITQNYMAGKLREAAYIFQNGANIQMSAAGGTSKSPAGSANFKVGTDPVLAFILPPKTVLAGGCTGATASTASDYCYTFYAFYAMKRSDYLSGASGADDPGDSPGNDATSWVLVEYRANYIGTLGFSVATINIPTGNRGRLLMDYLPPYSATSAKQLFNVPTSIPAATAGQTAGVVAVTLNLAAQQKVADQTIRLPSSDITDYSSVTVYPRNVGKPPLNN